MNADATDVRIDALVYELYGLTPEEIAVVEWSASRNIRSVQRTPFQDQSPASPRQNTPLSHSGPAPWLYSTLERKAIPCWNSSILSGYSQRNTVGLTKGAQYRVFKNTPDKNGQNYPVMPDRKMGIGALYGPGLLYLGDPGWGALPITKYEQSCRDPSG